MDGQTDKQTDRKVDRWTGRQKDRQTDRLTDRQTDLWTGTHPKQKNDCPTRDIQPVLINNASAVCIPGTNRRWFPVNCDVDTITTEGGCGSCNVTRCCHN